jgi:hypothetical protein
VDGTVTLGNSARANEAYTLKKVSAGLTAQADKKEAPSLIMSPKNEVAATSGPAYNYMAEYTRALGDPKNGSHAD